MIKSSLIKRLIIYSAIISCIANFNNTLQNDANYVFAFVMSNYSFAFGVSVITVVPYAILYFWASPPNETVLDIYVVLISSVLVCSTGIIGYGFYFIAGPSSQVNGAGQMHVVFSPALHTLLTLIILLFAFVIEKLTERINTLRIQSTKNDA